MTDSLFREERRGQGVVRLTLTRPDVRNAFNDVLIAGLNEALERLEGDPDIRVLQLAAEGASFSAGADLNWMKAMAGYDEAENVQDAMRMAELMERLNGFPSPTMALVGGAAMGGGVGLVACCDLVLAADTAVFALTEVRLGLVPAVISPYVQDAIGARAARRYFLTAERFTAEDARRLGLVHEVLPAEDLEARAATQTHRLLSGGPMAQRAAKDLIFTVDKNRFAPELKSETAVRIARLRASSEGQEGIAAFLDKTKPSWWSDGEEQPARHHEENKKG